MDNQRMQTIIESLSDRIETTATSAIGASTSSPVSEGSPLRFDAYLGDART